MITDGLAAARDASARQDWKQAYAGLSAADAAHTQLSAGDLEHLAEIHRLRGKFVTPTPPTVQPMSTATRRKPGLALLRLAQGEPRIAEAAILRVLGEPHARHRRAAVLAAGVEIMLENAELPAARAAADELASMAGQSEAPYLRALAAHAAHAAVGPAAMCWSAVSLEGPQ